MIKKENKTRDKKGLYRNLHKIFWGATAVLGLYGILNFWTMHKFDKQVIKHIEIAANVPSVGNYDGAPGLTMESALTSARKNTDTSRLRNPAIIWKTPITDCGVLEELLDKAISRAKEIQKFRESFELRKIEDDYPRWAKETFTKLDLTSLDRDKFSEILPALEELAQNEYGLRIASEYEALNSVISGGTRIKAKGLEERHKSMLDTLEKAGGWRSIIRAKADDYKEAHAHVFVGYLMANMGDLNRALIEFYEAKGYMDKYPDEQNISLIRKTPELNQKTIKELIDSSIRELTTLNNDHAKHSTGWWKRLTYYNRSIGGQANPSILDMAEAINGRYFTRSVLALIFGVCSYYMAGRYGKKYKLSKGYEVLKKNERL